MNFENLYKISQVKKVLTDSTNKIIEEGVTVTEPGSLKWLLWGTQASQQSISIKMGKVGEQMFKKMIEISPNIELIKCGVQIVDDKGKRKDIDLAWVDHLKRVVYIRECKGNIELDTEKLPATFNKVKEDIVPFLINSYPGYTIDCGILNWSVYSRKILKKTLSHIKKCETNDVKVDHVNEFLENINFEWSEEDYYSCFRGLGKKMNDMFI
jgi:hypothetical protein